MKASKFSEARKAFILKQAMTECQWQRFAVRRGISQATCFNWRKKCGPAA